MSTPRTPTNTNANIPGGAPLVDDNDQITQVWYQFLLALFNRSGGAGTPTDITALQKQVNAQNVAINTAVPVQPKPVLIGEGVVPIQRPAAPDFSQSMVYQPPGAYLTQASLSGYDTISAAIARYAAPPAIGTTTPASGAFTTLKANANAALSYTNTSGQSIPSAVATTVTGWTAAFDRNANFNAATGIFTAPNTGSYLISGQILFNLGAVGVNNSLSVSVIANSITVSSVSSPVYNTTQSLGLLPFTVAVQLTAGQTASIQALQATGSAKTLNVGAGANVISIVQVP